MAATVKSLETALSKLTSYIAPMEGNIKYIKQCAETLAEHLKVSEALETRLDNIIKDLKKKKLDELDPKDARYSGIEKDIAAWGHTQASLELRNTSAYCDTLLKYLLTALKEVPKAT